MKNSVGCVAMAAMLGCGPAAVSAQETVLLEPSSNWHLDYGDNRCRLARQFGADDQRHALIMEMDQPSTHVNLIVAGPSIDEKGDGEPYFVRFGDFEPIEFETYSLGNMQPIGAAFAPGRVSLDPPDDESEDETEQPRRTPKEYTQSPDGFPKLAVDRYGDVGSLSVGQDGASEVSFKVTGLSAALRSLNECAENLVVFWGLDLDQHRTMQQGPTVTNYSKIARGMMAEYPVEALRREEQGEIRFLVIVGADGSVEECRQSDVTVTVSLKSPVCRIMQRARFEPALDQGGNPMRSYYASQIRYQLPQ